MSSNDPGYYPPQSRYAGRPQPEPAYGGGTSYPLQAPPRRKRRVFIWVFLAIQALFIIWLIAGIASTGHTAPSAAELAQYCSASGSKSVLALYKSVTDCKVHYGALLSDAAGTGRGIGVALVVVLWCVVDFLTGITYAIYRLATRNR